MVVNQVIKNFKQNGEISAFGVNLWPFVEEEKQKAYKCGIPFMAAGVVTVSILGVTPYFSA